MSLHKDVVVCSTSVQALFGIVYAPTGDSLRLFEEVSPRGVFKVDLAAATGPEFQFDAVNGAWPSLIVARDYMSHEELCYP